MTDAEVKELRSVVPPKCDTRCRPKGAVDTLLSRRVLKAPTHEPKLQRVVAFRDENNSWRDDKSLTKDLDQTDRSVELQYEGNYFLGRPVQPPWEVLEGGLHDDLWLEKGWMAVDILAFQFVRVDANGDRIYILPEKKKRKTQIVCVHRIYDPPSTPSRCGDRSDLHFISGTTNNGRKEYVLAANVHKNLLVSWQI